MTGPGLAHSASSPGQVPTDRSFVIAACAALLMLAVALFDGRLLHDGDTYWHLAAGEWMLRHGQVPHVDPFSFTRLGAPWQAHEWLSEILMALTFRLGGWNGLVVLYGAALALAALLLTRQLARSLSSWLSLTLAVTLTLSCLAPSLLARPHVLVLPLVIGWTMVLLRAREAQRAPPWWAAVLILLWADLHGSFVFGFLLLGAFALEAIYESPPSERLRSLWAWGLFSALSLCAAAVTPEGPWGLVFPFKLMGMTSLAGIDEWRPTDFSRFSPFELGLAVTLFVCLTRGVRVAPVRVLLLIGLLHMALQHDRHVMVAALVAAMVLAGPIATALGQARPVPRPERIGGWLAFAAVALVLVGLRALTPLARLDGTTTPGAAIDHVPADLRTRPLLNDYGFGGYLIYRGVRPYVDGRTDLYGDAFMDRYDRIMRADPAVLDQTLLDQHVAWTILRPGTPLAAVLDARPGWRRLYADRFAVVHMRDSP
ncbi:MAG TPA: hypothetical protein VFW47_01745 [Phenylobacterium sp.]|nr:hypothetical protein [Phenylobacterium sp.]